MELQITGTNVEITPDVRRYVERKLGRLDRHLPNIIESKVEISEEKTKSPQQRYLVRATVAGGIGGAVFHGEDRGEDLFQAIDRMKKAARGDGVTEIRKSLVNEAERIHKDEVSATEKLSQIGAGLIKDGYTLLTHCNAGPLATAGYGTALGVIKAAKEQGKRVRFVKRHFEFVKKISKKVRKRIRNLKNNHKIYLQFHQIYLDFVLIIEC
jgi:ribosomal subunit interface protein